MVQTNSLELIDDAGLLRGAYKEVKYENVYTHSHKHSRNHFDWLYRSNTASKTKTRERTNGYPYQITVPPIPIFRNYLAPLLPPFPNASFRASKYSPSSLSSSSILILENAHFAKRPS